MLCGKCKAVSGPAYYTFKIGSLFQQLNSLVHIIRQGPACVAWSPGRLALVALLCRNNDAHTMLSNSFGHSVLIPPLLQPLHLPNSASRGIGSGPGGTCSFQRRLRAHSPGACRACVCLGLLLLRVESPASHTLLACGRPEALSGLRPETDAAIKASLHMCLTETDLGLGKRTVVWG